jgi:hypothetical protein
MSEQASVAQTAALAQEAKAETEHAASESAATGGSTSFASGGAIPSVAPGVGGQSRPSASERAYGGGDHIQTAATVQWHGGEPLPVLKDLFFSPLTEGNLHTFMGMIDHAPVRAGTHGIRTPISPADNLATIITDFVLRICNNYLPWVQKRHEAKHVSWIEHTIQNHLTLLDTPSHGSFSGGHLTRGLDGKLDALIGSTTPVDIAINQTAITLWTLEEMRENKDPHYQKLYGHKVDHLLALLFPEFKRELLRCYRPGESPHLWKYNTAGKLEDQGHLKTTWSQLQQLGQSKSQHASWYREQADRIAHASPHVLAPWNDQSGAAGSVH